MVGYWNRGLHQSGSLVLRVATNGGPQGLQFDSKFKETTPKISLSELLRRTLAQAMVCRDEMEVYKQNITKLPNQNR